MPTRPPLTLHRLMRLTTWARVWLEMVARVLPVGGGLGPYIGWMAPELARRVACLRVMALNLIFLRADARVTWTKPKLAHVMTKFGPVSRTRAPCPAGLRLKILGARLRRLTRGKVLPAQIRTLLQLLRDPEAEIARPPPPARPQAARHDRNRPRRFRRVRRPYAAAPCANTS